MSKLSQNSTEILENSGWYKGREIEIRHIVQFLKERGFEVYPAVKNFLEEYGMLNIKSPTYVTNEYIEKYNFPEYDEHSTDVYYALGDAGDVTYAEQYEYYAKEKLVIVGSIANGNLQLMISESGKVYCDSGKLGDTFEEAWETVFGYKKLVPWWLL